MAKLEEELEGLNDEQAALEGQVAGFNDKKHGYSDLAEWNAQLEALGPKIESVEEKWLALAERA